MQAMSPCPLKGSTDEGFYQPAGTGSGERCKLCDRGGRNDRSALPDGKAVKGVSTKIAKPLLQNEIQMAGSYFWYHQR